MIVPRDRTRYARAEDEALRLSHAAYWVSLADCEKIQGAACNRRVPIVVPKQNLLTVESLVALIEGKDLQGRTAS